MPTYALSNRFGIEFTCDKSLDPAGLYDSPAPIAYSAVKYWASLFIAFRFLVFAVVCSVCLDFTNWPLWMAYD